MPQSEDNKSLVTNLPDSVWQILNEGNELGFHDGGESHPTFDDLVEAIERTMTQARNVAARHVYNDQLLAYWNNGRMIVIYEQDGKDRAEYGDKTLVKLSKRLTEKMGRGFSRTNLQYMRLLYLKYPKCQTLSGKLSFSHYCELLDFDDDEKRSFYEHEAANAGWSVRELRRQMDSMLFERILNAKDEARKDHVLALANEGVAYSQPSDALRTPVVLEFLDLPDDVAPLERDLQKALVAQIEKFMLELGRGFMFVGSNVRIPVGSDKDFADMVFYCKPLRAYVIIELKSTKLLAAAVGQINEYLNYYATEVNDEYDNPPIGIILCTDKNNVRAEYALGGLSNAIFASTYTLRLPNKEQLEDQVRRTIEANERKALMSGEEDA
ncbi:MAG: DUF1016 family protein [Eggerthellaceae bacterium]|nr:DUF1016 family protein [Eggerthellaceae bacterium]